MEYLGFMSSQIYLGSSPIMQNEQPVTGGYREMLGESFYKIDNYDQMPSFFMSIVSAADHWLFISSTGGLTAGRVNAESALFPYYTDDKITENSDNTGHLALFLVERESRRYLWEPFSAQCADLYRVERNLYKNVIGDKLIFEEINRDLGLTYRYAWRTSSRFGFVKTSWLQNDLEEAQTVSLLDGLQNVLPYGASVALQTQLSNLLNGYKRSELEPETGLGIFALNATLTDLAEPSESLKATTVWRYGLDDAKVLLSSEQVAAWQHGGTVAQTSEVRGRRGAYLAATELTLESGEEQHWHFVAEVNQDHRDMATLLNVLRGDGVEATLEADIVAGSAGLRKIVASADGLQFSADTLTTNHHFANVLFNTMRGGIFANNYQIEKSDLLDFIQTRNRAVLADCEGLLSQLPAQFSYGEMLAMAARGSVDLQRLAYEYLPLTFSRRHGDPSRPWNKFSINITHDDGSQRLDYQGNWRDIFQNWEPLAWSYPEFIEGMIAKFLNATTADGYNPYRVTRDGIEWEAPEPDDPWANIGYWSDHQIVYLHRLLDISRRVHPGKLKTMLDQAIFSHADVPYRIKRYDDILRDAYDTILFDWSADERTQERVTENGSDGKLVHDANGNVLHVNLAEKLLLLLLVKLGNFVPEGGIWMITQRPEWNDANNALVGKGMSVITLGHLRGYIAFLQELLADVETLQLSQELSALFDGIQAVFAAHEAQLASSFDDETRREMMDALGQASSDHRWGIYESGLSGESLQISGDSVREFLALAQRYIDHSLLANRREDDLFHTYNILSLSKSSASIGHLQEMLEGQVSILATGLLSAEQSLTLLKQLRNSDLYRADQHSYLLYPDKELTGFLGKNCVSAEKARQSQLVAAGNTDILRGDENGDYHFNPSFRNAKDLRNALDELKDAPQYSGEEAAYLQELFEETFNHKAFTGRSGTFFAFEGLGSIYWHQVSKLLLAVQETAMRTGDPALVEAYYDVRSGIGFNKSADVYGAFPTDPYSHTPANAGAKQPGMTGQVKEEIITRMAELGVSAENGKITFAPTILRDCEFSDAPTTFEYVDVNGDERTLDVPAGAIAFTFCQVPVVYQRGSDSQITIQHSNGSEKIVNGITLDSEMSRAIFARTGEVERLTVLI